MKVAELIDILQNVDPNADVKLSAGYEDDLCIEQIVLKGSVVEIDLNNFVDDFIDYNEMLSAM